ncbi:hypothetical protein QBC40DRAFT_325265 [Triangularia verruculosa]|uniref:Uncharacterized protein n=1 Tax=Triangularia verruculosa TaxID=2587418 RepID=A0AAN6XNF8_9PEZI|nr:hypothetical protein QBC40DRAFT_325265 [Triangularia verruculosa]
MDTSDTYFYNYNQRVVRRRCVGNFPITWEPVAPRTAIAQRPTTAFPWAKEELRRRFIAYIEAQIAQFVPNMTTVILTGDPVDYFKLMALYCLLGMARDPHSAMEVLDATRMKAFQDSYGPWCTPEDAFDHFRSGYIAKINNIATFWFSVKHEQKESGEWFTKPVPGQCLLSGVNQEVKLRSIIPIGSNKYLPGTNEHWVGSWIESFYSLGDAMDAFKSHKLDDERNFLPLDQEIRRRWDLGFVAFRPIAHPTDPGRLYLQLVYLVDIAERGKTFEDGPPEFVYEVEAGDQDLAPRPPGRPPAAIQGRHGDVYELSELVKGRGAPVTDSDDVHVVRLPRMDYLRVRYAIQKLTAGMGCRRGVNYLRALQEASRRRAQDRETAEDA